MFFVAFVIVALTTGAGLLYQFKESYLSKLKEFIGDQLVSDAFRLEIYKDINYAIENGEIEKVQALFSDLIADEEQAIKSAIDDTELSKKQLEIINKAVEYTPGNCE